MPEDLEGLPSPEAFEIRIDETEILINVGDIVGFTGDDGEQLVFWPVSWITTSKGEAMMVGYVNAHVRALAADSIKGSTIRLRKPRVVLDPDGKPVVDFSERYYDDPFECTGGVKKITVSGSNDTN